jgi:Fe2+ or Zn2+ uptake regulation protein
MDNAFVSLCTDRLKLSGARITKPRLAVMRCLGAARSPLTAREISGAVQRSAKVDQVTVYRILSAFAELGLVHQVGPAGGFVACSHLACNSDLHILSHCTSCGRSEEIEVPAAIMSPVRWYLTNAAKFSPGDHVMQVNGRCAGCR